MSDPSPPPGSLVAHSQTDADRVVISLSGELDLATVQFLDRELRAVESANPGLVVIDLSRVQFMDSTGLRALLRARESADANGHRLVLKRGPAAVQRVLELTQTADLFAFDG